MVVTEEIHSLIQDIVYENGFTRFDKASWSSLLAFQSGIPFSRDLLDEIITNTSNVYKSIKNSTARFHDKLLNGETKSINDVIKISYPDSITEVFNAVVKLSPETQIEILPLFYEYTPEFLSENMVSNAIATAENTAETTTTDDTYNLAEEDETDDDDAFDLSADTAEDRLVALLQQKMNHPSYRTYAKKMVRGSLSESKPLQVGRCTKRKPNQCVKITPGARRNVLRQVLYLEENGQITEEQADLFIQNLALPESL